MNNYRLHIDIPLSDDEKTAVRNAKQIIGIIEGNFSRFRKMEIEKVNVRLGHDGDRQKSNYLIKDEYDHVSNKKIKMFMNK
tara:strand:- start:137 stop:379 length:243 start_codon:yes stop_codon:yes gene_type:complete